MKLRPAARWALAVAVGGCHRAPADGSVAAVAIDAAMAAPTDAAVALLPARCRRTDTAFALDDGRGLAGLEVGDGLAYPGGYAVGLVHRTAAGQVAAVALLRRDPIGLTRVVDLGPTLGDAPPPRIGWRSGELVAAASVRPRETTPPAQGERGDATSDVAIYTVADGALVGAPLSVPQRRDDSLALDVAFAGAAGLLVWDEATRAPRGVVKAAAFTRDRAAPTRDVSPPDSDAELPRVVAEGNGFAVIWIARRAEPGSGLDGAAAEATGEARSYGWLEMVAVDAQGVPTAPVRRLTPTDGHVSAYDVEAPAGGAARTLLVVARDDGEAVDGSGGVLLRVRVTGDEIALPVAFATEGLGRGAPSFVSLAGSPAPSSPTAAPSSPGAAGSSPGSAAASLALAWVAGGEQARLLPLDPAGNPTAAPSAEDALDDARALLFMSAPTPAADTTADTTRVLVATPSDSAAQLRVFACAR